MTKPARFPRSLYLVPGLLLLAFLTLVFWPQSPPSAEVIANRGKYRAFPVEFSIFAPDSWKVSSSEIDDWLDQGAHTFRRWQDPTLPPSNNARIWFFDHLWQLKFSDKPEDRAEYQRLVKLGEPWFQNLLNRYPELKIDPKKLPDERNGLHRLIALKVQLGRDNCSRISTELQELARRSAWKPDEVRAWLDAHRDLMDELREIGQMTESSNVGLESLSAGIPTSDLRSALLLQARLAAEQGDWQASLENVRAASGIARLVRNADGAVIYQEAGGAMQEEKNRNMVLEFILPSIPRENLDLAAWRDALRPEPRPPSDFTTLLRSEWNTMTRYVIIPALLDPANNEIPPDAEYLVDAYTEHMENRVKDYSNPQLGQPADVSWTDFDQSTLSQRGLDVIDSFSNNLRLSWDRSQLRAGLTEAAFDILQGKPVPNDPVYGLPYQWDPETRILSLSRKQERNRYGIRPIKLPKL